LGNNQKVVLAAAWAMPDALAAAAEISQRVFEETGDLQPTIRTWANAQAFASMKNSYLAQYGVKAMVTGISVDAGEVTVLVQVSANLDRLFPSVMSDVIVRERGFAEIRALNRQQDNSIELNARLVLAAYLSIADVLFPANQEKTNCMRPRAGQALQLALLFT
jgi:hypothetical protein